MSQVNRSRDRRRSSRLLIIVAPGLVLRHALVRQARNPLNVGVAQHLQIVLRKTVEQFAEARVGGAGRVDEIDLAVGCAKRVDRGGGVSLRDMCSALLLSSLLATNTGW